MMSRHHWKSGREVKLRNPLALSLTVLIFGCSSDSSIEYQEMLGTWKSELVAEKTGELIGPFYFYFGQLGATGTGKSCQILPNKGSDELSPICMDYRPSSRSEANSTIYFDLNAPAGWVKKQFIILKKNENQAVIDGVAYFKVLDDSELQRIHQVVDAEDH